MFHDPKTIKVMNTIALTFFVIIMVISLLITIVGVAAMIDWDKNLHEMTFDYSADDPGAGWLVLGQAFGSVFGSLAVGFIAAFGITGLFTGILHYLPAFIARIVYQKTKNVKVYWIFMGLWLIPTVLLIAELLPFGGLFSLGF